MNTVEALSAAATGFESSSPTAPQFFVISIRRQLYDIKLTDFSSPLPGHPPLAGGTGLVEVTGSTSGLIDHSGRLSKQKIKY